MKRGIIGIFACLLVTAVAFLAIAGTGNLRKVDMHNPALVDQSSTAHLSAEQFRESKDVRPPAVIDFKADDTLFYQRPYQPNESWTFHTSDDDAGYRCYENFWDLAGRICDIHWWGLSMVYPWADCDPAGMVFEIKFYSDDPTDTAQVNMPPSDVVCTYTNVTPSYTYYDTYGDFTCYYFSFDLDPCCDLRDGWVSIQSTYSPNDCWFLWSGSPPSEGDGFAFQEGGDPIVNDLAIVLTGKPEEEWPNHKMHFPQLPDLEGWDVNATYPKTLADDWQCSQSGPVTDIHFWGSWKDLDGNPGTDDFRTPMPWFILSIHRNIPADQDTPWSRPGELLWAWEGEIPGIPFEPPAMEHWYDPNTDSSYCNDHIAYWRYDFFFDQAQPPAEPFIQDKDSIYWLNISVPYMIMPFQWGWKSSRDHFMDDAVYTDNAPVGPWSPMVEPPRCNWFDVYFDSLGEPEDMQSTNYYGSGWYKYEYWWNMWFYDNPFAYERPKQIYLDFWVEPVGPQAYAEFAINWSTDLWSLEGVPGRPPLPGEDEELYIGREILPVELGPNFIEYVIPYYNPEWVSIDFVAQDVIINGWIWHECYQTSMDLAFVITGGEEDAEFIRGDYDANGVLAMPDALGLLLYKYHQPGGVAPPCEDAGDYDDSGELAMPDALALLLYKYHQPGGVPPPPPYPDCGIDPTDDGLGCDSYPPCGTKVAKPLISSASASVENASNVVKLGEGYLAEDGLVIVPVELTNEAELRGFEFTVNFDPALLTAAKVGGGDGYDFFAPWIDNETGKVTIGCVPDLSMHKPFTPGQRVVAEISFQPKGNASLSLSDVALYGLRAEVVDARWIDGILKAGVGLPMQFALQQNYPNPFNAITEIKYALPKDCLVRLEVYNVVGQRVATLADGKQKAGYKVAKWQASSFSSGIYFYTLRAGDFVQTRKMILLK